MIGIVAPGQGSQKPGFLREWLDVGNVTATLEQLSEPAGIDLIRHGTEADAKTIRDTAIAQPLLVASSLATARELLARTPWVGSENIVTAGHSIGELASAAIAGVFDDKTAVELAAKRGRIMAAASSVEPTGMSAVLGGETDDLLTLFDSLGLTAANINGSGQIVAAGPISSLAKLHESVPLGVKVVALKVAGAFHSHYMASAADEFSSHIAPIPMNNPTVTSISNADGEVVSDGDEIASRLVRQVKSPVRWDLTIARIHSLGVRKVIELNPAGTLSRMIKRTYPEMQVVGLESPADLTSAVDLTSK